MNIIYEVFQAIMKAGTEVFLPIIITLLGMVFGLKLSKAFKSGLTVGIGFIGIKLVINMMSLNLGPAAKGMVQNFGIHLDIIDVGWGAIAAITWSSPIIPVLIATIFITNMVMLIIKATDTLDVDIWNYHHMAIIGVMTYFVTQNMLLSMGATFAMAVIALKLSDWSAPLVERFFGLPNISLPTMSALSSLIIVVPVNWLLDRIPGVNSVNLEIKDTQKYLGFFGEPMMMGFILGTVIGLMAKYTVVNALFLGVGMAAVMVLIPKMTSLFVEGLLPISQAATEFMKKKFKGRKFHIGLDAAVIVGNQNVITTALIVIPLTIIIAAVIPGNRVLPFADLAVVTFRVAMVVAVCRGNLFKSIIVGCITMAAVLLAGTITSPVLTALAQNTGLEVANNSLISCFAATSLTVSFLVYEAFTNYVYITIPSLLIVFGLIWAAVAKKQRASVEA